MTGYSDEELLATIQELAAEYGRPPTLQEIDDDTKYTRRSYFTHFESWQAALEKAGFEPRPPQTAIAKDDLIAELQRVADDLGHPPSIHEMNEHGEYWGSTYRNHFGSWSAAVEAAGFEPAEPHQKIVRDRLIAELERLSDELGKRPTFREMEDDGEFDPTTYIREFGSWTDALEAAGFGEPRGVTADGLIEHLQELADKLDKRPSQRDMNEHGDHSHTTYVRYFGSWSNAIEAAFEDS